MGVSAHSWCLDLSEGVGLWLSTLYDAARPGLVKYSRRGNLLEPSVTAGLGASCLALKVAYQIGMWDDLEPKVRRGWVDHVRSFQRADTGFFEDPSVLAVADSRASRPRLSKQVERVWRRLQKGKQPPPVGIAHRPSGRAPKRLDLALRRAESRQAAAALLAVGSGPAYLFYWVPEDEEELLAFLRGLPWYWRPWHAGSHTSLMVFGLKLNADVFGRQEAYTRLISVALSFLDAMQDPETGAWFRRSWQPRRVPVNEQVNGAMKVLTAYELLERPFRWPGKLIDLCLDSFDARDACHSVDALYVLHACAKWTAHRRGEVKRFAGAMLQAIKAHHRQDGALSFFPDHANTHYYGVPVSHGLAESDVQGTHLLVWAVTLCADLLGFRSELGWNLPVT